MLLRGVQMWSDNETNVDYLGFSDVVDELVAAITTDRLLPLTIGVLGDWGSGKSSVISMAREAIEIESAEDDSRRITVAFSPWQHESYAEVRTALMSAVLEALATAPGIEDEQTLLDRLRRFVRRVSANPRMLGRFAAATAPAVLTFGAAAIDPSIGVDFGNLAEGAALAAATQTGRELDASDPSDEAPIANAQEFREALASLIDSTGVDSVLVFIDDLDRCLPDTVVSTFEAIRIFLNTPKTAYIIAANQPVVTAAIERRYPADGFLAQSVGAHYLEKMMQMTVTVPPLAPPQSETYMNLLLAELHLDGDKRLADLVAKTADRRRTRPMGIGFSIETLEEDLDSAPDSLVNDLSWSAQIAPAVAVGLRGNPREIKRFLNTISMRQRGAARRDVVLDPAVIAKLLVLETTAAAEAERLYSWIVSSDGPPEGLRNAELIARGGEADEAELAGAADWNEWASVDAVRSWLLLDPVIGSTDLHPYISLTRSGLTSRLAVARLSEDGRRMLELLTVEADARRREAVRSLSNSSDSQMTEIIEALAEAAVRRPGSKAIVALIEIAEAHEAHSERATNALQQLPMSAVAPVNAMVATNRLPNTPTTEALLSRWSNGSAALETAITTVRRRRAD